MKLISRRIELPDFTTPVKIKPIFDIHSGHRNIDYKFFEKICKEIKEDPHYYWIGGGDYGEYFNRRDKRHKEEDLAQFCWGVDDLPKRQTEYVLDHLSPIKDKCLMLLRGNHESSIQNRTGYDIMSRISAGLGAYERYTGFEGFLNTLFHFGGKCRYSFVTYCHHGYGGGTLKGSYALALQRVFMWKQCDVAFMGHRHIRFRDEQIIEVPIIKTNRVETQQRISAFCGTFKSRDSNERHDGWESEKGLPPNIPRGYYLEIDPNHKYMELREDKY